MGVTSGPKTTLPTNNGWFDNRILSLSPVSIASDPTLGQSGLTRGYMMNATLAGQSSAGLPSQAVYFLYNPNIINVSHSLDPSNAVIPAYLRSTADTGVPLVTTGGTLGFDLLFDRTYEVNDQTQAGTMPHDLGVNYDLYSLYKMTGILEPVTKNDLSLTPGSAATSSTAGSSGSTTSSTPTQDQINQAVARIGNAVVGTLQMLPIWCNFASITAGNYTVPTGTNANNVLPDMILMRYFGYVTSLAVGFTHFNQRMVPMRMGVQVSMALMSTVGYA